MLETGDQAVYRKAVGPGNGDPFEGRRLLQALAARHAGGGQGQGAGLTLVAEPGKLGFTGGANGCRVIGRFAAQQAVLYVF
ncbi:hypothetical protein D3C87_1940710 [compost metagenome]